MCPSFNTTYKHDPKKNQLRNWTRLSRDEIVENSQTWTVSKQVEYSELSRLIKQSIEETNGTKTADQLLLQKVKNIKDRSHETRWNILLITKLKFLIWPPCFF